MSAELHYKTKAWLRRTGEYDNCKYSLSWVNSVSMIDRWEYANIPRPTTAQLDTIVDRDLDFDPRQYKNHDLYVSEKRIISVGTYDLTVNFIQKG